MNCVSGRARCCPEVKLIFQEASLLHLQSQNRRQRRTDSDFTLQNIKLQIIYVIQRNCYRLSVLSSMKIGLCQLYHHVFRWLRVRGAVTQICEKWPVGLTHCEWIGRFSVGIPLRVRPDLGTEPHYKTPGNLQVKYR